MDEETEVFDFDKICRLCLLEKPSMLRIFAKKKRNNATPLPIRIMSCASLEVYQGDGLPDRICPKCLWSVNQAYTFREVCDAANTRLLKYVHRMKDINTPPSSHNEAEDEPMEFQNETQHATPLEFLDEQITISEHPSVDLNIKSEQLDIKSEPEEDEDDKPIITLMSDYSRSLLQKQKEEKEKEDPPTIEEDLGGDESTENDFVGEEDGRVAENGIEACDEDVDGGTIESDCETEPVVSLVETEMPLDIRPSSEITSGKLKEQLPVLCGNGEVTITPTRPINVRRYLETEFSCDPTYNSHKKFYVVGSEYKMKKKQRASPQKNEAKSSAGRYTRDGWEPFNVLDLKPRKKYAPREKNLISNNSSPIIEQDGTKSKFRACAHCGKVVLGKNMGIHIKIHVGNKSHLCDICGKSFLYKKTLETHKRVHSGERPCVCKICGKTFRSSSRLSDHMSTHTGRKPFICEICAVAFRIKGHLKKHLRVHSGEKPYVCSFCEKAFSDAWNMKCHLRIHTGEKPPHACPVCGQCFLRRNKMEEHCKLTHGEEYVLPRKQNIVQRLKNDLIEMNEELRAISEREREDMLRQETERQLLQSHFESQRQELADHLAISMPLPMPVPVPAFPGNLPSGIFGLQ